MVPLGQLTKDSILSDEILMEVFDQEDEIYKARLLLSLEDRAAELGVKGKFTKLVNAFKKVEKNTRQKKQQHVSLVENYTNFTGTYDNMMCGSWVASDAGIYTFNKDYSNEVIVCYHPILPIERLRNLETGEEQLKLAFKRNHSWREIIVPKDLVSSANKIVALSKLGVAVTSENAKLLVKYLSDVENLNDDHIPVQKSTSKLGWIAKGFMPYDDEVIFDGDTRFKQLFESIQEHGDKNSWYKHVKELRKSGRMEIKFLLAASFASVLVKPLGGLPFFVDLWGETEGGKTVSLMVATSIWANPDESRYIGDFKTTDVALEARADMLNNLPVILDDTSKTSAKIRDNFEGFVYDLCSGKGKSRSNKELGMNRENRWSNCILTNGERPLNSYVNQGGAINRILEVECGEKVYKSPQRTADIVKKNYGFAGKEFVKLIQKMGIDYVLDIQREILGQLQDDDKMQKQSLSLSIVLTADKIVTDMLFCDGQYISMDEARTVLVDRNELSDNERCYRYLLDKVAMNAQRFDLVTNVEKWGVLEREYAVFFNQAFDELCKSGGFSKKSFLSWADRKNLIQTQNGRYNKVKKIDGNPYRCIFLKLEEEPMNEGFMDADGEEPPFK
jgi:hypothetical protein